MMGIAQASPDVVYRLPPLQLGPRVYMYAEVKDQQPWSLVKQNVEPLWADTKGKGITVAVLDTGLWRHRDLPDPVFAANFSNSRDVYDRQGHGTHVAGTIGARLNGAGVVGYAPECNLACVKVLGDDGSGSDDAIAKGIRYAADQGADVINMSLGGVYSKKIAQACKDVIQQGKFVICAAGNEGAQGGNTVGYPAKLEETIAIASFNERGEISVFSSRGPEVDVAFPGEDILSTWPNDAFRRISGTSMATPAACGVLALMLAYRKTRPSSIQLRHNADLRELWKKTAQDVGAPGHDNSFGWGVPNVADSIKIGTGNPAPTDPTLPEPVPTGDGSSLFGIFHTVPAKMGDKTGWFVYVG